MVAIAVFVTATKLAGLQATLTVAANVFSFSLYRKQNLRPFRSPIDESDDTFVDFNLDQGEDGFFFGLATAPAHIKDKLDDAWLQFAQENPCDKVESEGDRKTVDAIMASATGDGGSHPAHALEKPTKPIKIAMEAMIRGYAKYVEGDTGEEEEKAAPAEECQHKVAAWHNVENP